MIGPIRPALRKIGKGAALLVGAVVLLPAVVVPMARDAFTPDCDDHHRFLKSGGVPGLWAVDADGSNQRRIAGLERGASAWSPDRSLIATLGPDGTGADYGLYLMNADGSDRSTLIPAPVYTPDAPGDELPGTWTGEFVSGPAWSPDGQRLAFVAYGRTSGVRIVDWNPSVDPYGDDGDPDLYLVGSNRVRLTDNEIYEHEPAWSPDGKRIAFRSDRGIETISTDGFRSTGHRPGRVRLRVPAGTRLVAGRNPRGVLSSSPRGQASSRRPGRDRGSPTRRPGPPQADAQALPRLQPRLVTVGRPDRHDEPGHRRDRPRRLQPTAAHEGDARLHADVVTRREADSVLPGRMTTFAAAGSGRFRRGT